MPQAQPPPDDLIRLTNEHWTTRGDDTEWYIQNLLDQEMHFAQQELEPCGVLALMVGFSPDPLLQTIWKYRPGRIVLVLNHAYGSQRGKRRADEWIEWIGLMAEKGFCAQTAVPRLDRAQGERLDIAIASQEATPDWVFRELRDRLLPDQRAGNRIVVDITGAKKNMAAGAFLFAAYAGADISYVDFAEYNPEKRRPQGYTCRIGTQPNPYRILGLRDWERVQKLYEQFAFGSAGKELAQLASSMEVDLADIAGAGDYFNEEQRRAVVRLAKVLAVLDQWDNGDFTSAWEQWWSNGEEGGKSLHDQMPTFPLPRAVRFLGSRNWPSAASVDAKAFLQQHRDLKRGMATPEDSIFNQPDVLLTYASDELDKIKSLIDRQNDYRSAFLRSAGLDELLLKARVAILWLTDQLLFDGNERIALSREKEPFDMIAEHPSADGLRNFLRTPTGGLKVQRGKSIFTRKSSSNSEMKEYWTFSVCSGCTIDHQTLVKLRGEAIHTHLSIPKPYAQAAYQTVNCALEDFNNNWVPRLKKPVPTYQTWQLTWSDLCTHCKLDFLPALPTSKEEAS